MCDIVETKTVRVVRNARRHKVGVARILAVMNGVNPTEVGDQLVFVGVDDRGVEIEIIAVPDDKHPATLAVIHAMPTEFRKGKGDGTSDEADVRGRP